MDSDAIMIAETKRALTNVLQDEDLYVDHQINPITIGNLSGLSFSGLPSQIDVLRQQANVHDARVISLEENIALLATNNTVQETNITSLQNRLSSLKTSLATYFLLRHHFICTFKRDKLHNASE